MSQCNIDKSDAELNDNLFYKKIHAIMQLIAAFNHDGLLQLLRSDEYWMYATPNTYNGVDISNPPLQTQGLESSA